MLTITESAGAIIANTLEAHRQAADDVFRVMYAGSDLALSMGGEHDGDIVIRHENRPILVLEASIAEALNDLIVDTDSQDPSRLVIKTAADSEAV